MKREFISRGPAETRKLARSLASLFLKNRSKKNALIICLKGDLGSGKTTFLQGFAKGLGIKERILSPTFVIMKRFKIKDLRFKNFFHIDCYKIKKPKDLLDLGFKKNVFSPENIVAVEWPEKIKKIFPKNTIWLIFEFIDEKTRKIIIKK